MNFKFEFLNIHINHLTQVGMITITLKWQNKNIFTIVWNSQRFSTPFWLLLACFDPKNLCIIKSRLHDFTTWIFYENFIVLCGCLFVFEKNCEQIPIKTNIS
jgi:hypothetical protein